MSARPGPPAPQNAQNGRPGAVFSLFGITYANDPTATELSPAESTDFNLPGARPLFDHEQGLAGSSFVVNLIHQMEALSPGVVLHPTGPCPLSHTGGPS